MSSVVRKRQQPAPERTFHYFLKLPVEIRIMIYQLVLVSLFQPTFEVWSCPSKRYPSNAPPHWRFRVENLRSSIYIHLIWKTAILRTSNQVYAEAVNIVYRNTTFNIQIPRFQDYTDNYRLESMEVTGTKEYWPLFRIRSLHMRIDLTRFSNEQERAVESVVARLQGGSRLKYLTIEAYADGGLPGQGERVLRKFEGLRINGVVVAKQWRFRDCFPENDQAYILSESALEAIKKVIEGSASPTPPSTKNPRKRKSQGPEERQEKPKANNLL